MLSFNSEQYHLHGIINSQQGGRPENQDDAGSIETALGWLLVLCDGMGGGPGGKTASDIVKHVAAQHIASCNEQSNPITALKEAVYKAEEALEQRMETEPALRGMGSTVVLLLVTAHAAYVAHAGDSRLYRFSEGKVRFRTQDHSLVGELVKSKALTEEQARLSPQSNVITRGLGNTSNHIPEIQEIPYKKGDRFVACTDGVWGCMPHDDLVKRFLEPVNPDLLAERLAGEIDQIGYARGGGHDNHTLAIVVMETNSILKDQMEKYYRWGLLIASALLLLSVIFNVICCHRIKIMNGQLASNPVAPTTFFASANNMSSQGEVSASVDEPQKGADNNGEILADSIFNELRRKKDICKKDSSQNKSKECPDSIVLVRDEVLAMLNQLENEKNILKDKAQESKQNILISIEQRLLKLVTLSNDGECWKKAYDFVTNKSNCKKMKQVARKSEGAPFEATQEAKETIDSLRLIIKNKK